MKAKLKLTSEVFALCLLVASALQIMDGLLPKIPIFPWLRLGLSHLIILPFIIRFGSLPGCILLLSRNLIALLYGGQLFTSFLISSLSGVLSILLFAPPLLYLYRKNIVGLSGLSIMLATTFNLFQLLCVNFFFVQNISFFIQISPLLGWSVFSGFLIAVLVYKGEGWLKDCFESDTSVMPPKGDSKNNVKLLLRKKTLFLVGLFIGALLLQGWMFQCVLWLFLVLLLKGRHLHLLIYAWPYYFYLIWLHLLGTHGVYILNDWVTLEGLQAFGFYFIRTMNIILCGKLISQYLQSLDLRFSGSVIANGFSMTLPVLPSLFGLAFHSGKEILGNIKNQKFDGLFTPIIHKLKVQLRHRD